jgi:DNA ligase (NAD+)
LDEVIVDGEVIITYDDFDKINANLPEGQKYRNPRNLASGSIRQLDSSVAASRNMKFIAWKLVKGWFVGRNCAAINKNSFFDRLYVLTSLGFDIVSCIQIPSIVIREDIIKRDIDRIKEYSKEAGHPIDGCVFSYDDIKYGESLGSTGHHLRSQLAFKFYDEVYDTKLLYIDWTMGRTGQLTPTAVFEPVEIDGTIVKKASLHNISVMHSILGKRPYVGQTIWVQKSNMIIPQVVRSDKND